MGTKAIGIMSGTSADGVDAVLLRLPNARTPSWPEVLAHAFVAYPDAVRTPLLQPGALSVSALARLHFSLPHVYAEAVHALPGWQAADVVGLHGQTVAHEVGAFAPAVPCTLQIGSSAVLASLLGLPVVGDMRAADVAEGGRGAPLVPFAHWFFLRGQQQSGAVVNFGGICNVSWAPPHLDGVRGSDVGPGMMLSDAWAMRCSGGAKRFDADGALSAGGRRVPALYTRLREHPFVQAALPKAGGREQFGAAFFDPLFAQCAQAPAADVAFTLLEATADILTEALLRPPFAGHRIEQVVLTGGGAKNPVLVRLCQQRLAAHVHGEVGVAHSGPLAPAIHEPAAMALIAARTWQQLPSNLPAVTGAAHAVVLGHVHAPPRALPVTAGP